jgi:HK97 family phage major capsid protein/HK97 family phage prohead protease
VTGELHSRVFALDDISIRAGGDGRTVTAYAAVFESPAEIKDSDGHYQEQIGRTAFDKTLQERAGRIGVFYNHAKTLHGASSELGSVPIGTPLEMRADGRGLLTVTRYNKTPLADAVLESIRNGDITGQSFTGRFIKSDPRGPYLPERSGELTLVTRQEIALVEYGPTPIPAYADAEIVGVRMAQTVETLLREGMSPEDALRAAGGDGDRGNITAASAGDLDEAARKFAAAQGWAMPDGSYPIRPANMHGRGDLEDAIRAVGRGSGSHEEIRAHIIKRAKAIGMADMIPSNWNAGAPSAAGSTPPKPAGPPAAAGANTTSSGRASAGTSAAEGTGAATEPAAEPETEPRPHSATRNNSSGESEMDERMTVEERTARQSEIRARMAEIDTEHSGAALPEPIQTEWDGLQAEYAEHDRAITASQERAALLRNLAETPGATERVETSRAGFVGGAPAVIRRPDDIYDLAAVRQQARSIDEVPGLYRDRAMRAIETSQFPGAGSREDAQERAAHLVDTIDDEHATLARRMLTTGSPLYARAFGKMMTKLSTNGLTAEESRALSLGTDASGGYAVPMQLDPTIILTSDGTINPLRQVARQVQIVGKQWEGVTSAGVTVTRGAEASEAPDSTPTLAQPSVGTTRVQGFVPFSVEIERSWNEMRGEVTMLLQDAKDTEEATSFVTGDGTGTNPNGIIGTLAAGSKVGQTGAAGTLTVPDDIFAVEEALPPRFRARASWLANKSIYNMIRGSASGKSGYAGDLWSRLQSGMPPELIGYPARELSSMDGTIESSGAGANLVLLFGDYMRAFLIVDRIGMSVEVVPHLFGSNGRPTGQRGIYAYWSNNCKILVPNALRVLNVVSPT